MVRITFTSKDIEARTLDFNGQIIDLTKTRVKLTDPTGRVYIIGPTIAEQRDNDQAQPWWKRIVG